MGHSVNPWVFDILVCCIYLQSGSFIMNIQESEIVFIIVVI